MMNKEKNSNQAVKILNPIAEYLGVIIHETEEQSYCFFDVNGYLHSRNTKLCKRDRLNWIKEDMSLYLQKGWL
jgi:hypothetical protein